MNLRTLGLAAAALLPALGLLVLAPPSAGAAKGQMAPDFTGTTLDGRTVTLSAFRGKGPVVLNFYADFCPPCRVEFPHLKTLADKHAAKGLRVIAVSLDQKRERAEALPKQHGIRFPVVFEPKGVIAEKYQVQAIPHTVVIDREGRIHRVLIGLDLEGLDEAVAQVID